MRRQSRLSLYGTALSLTVGLTLLAGCDPKKDSTESATNAVGGTNSNSRENSDPETLGNMAPPDVNEARAQMETIKQNAKPPEEAFKTQEHGKGPWKPEPDKAEKLAKSIDLKLNNLKNGIMQARMFVEIPDRGVGKSETINIVRDSKRYQLKYPIVTQIKKSEISSMDVIAKDGKVMTVARDKVTSSREMPPPMTLEQFGYNFSSYISSGILTKEAPFTKLISLAKAAKWSIKTDSTLQNGIHSTRLLLKSPAKDKIYELIVSDDRGYPTTIRTTFGPGVKKTKLAWFGFWAFKPTAVTEDDFKMTPYTSPIASHPAPGTPAAPKRTTAGPAGAKTN